jgi:hypothetical protein
MRDIDPLGLTSVLLCSHFHSHRYPLEHVSTHPDQKGASKDRAEDCVDRSDCWGAREMLDSRKVKLEWASVLEFFEHHWWL